MPTLRIPFSIPRAVVLERLRAAESVWTGFAPAIGPVTVRWTQDAARVENTHFKANVVVRGGSDPNVVVHGGSDPNVRVDGGEVVVDVLLVGLTARAFWPLAEKRLREELEKICAG